MVTLTPSRTVGSMVVLVKSALVQTRPAGVSGARFDPMICTQEPSTPPSWNVAAFWNAVMTGSVTETVGVEVVLTTNPSWPPPPESATPVGEAKEPVGVPRPPVDELALPDGVVKD